MRKHARQMGIAILAVGLLGAGGATAQEQAPKVHGYTDTPIVPGTHWHVHDPNRPQPVEVVTQGAVSVPAPSDAIVLFDGSAEHGFVSTRSGGETDWVIADGILTVNPTKEGKNGGSLRTRERFGDMQLHVEWRAPTDDLMDPVPQRAGNSGVYIMGRYEVQIQHSYRNPTYADGMAGSLYGQRPPLVNPSVTNGEWQSYDIIWEAPRFDEDGVLTKKAHATVIHNGVVVQHRTPLNGPTGHRSVKPYEAHPEELPFVLQDHAEPVSFRNIWVRRLKLEE